MIQSDNLS